MIKEHLASTVETALRKSKPSKAFTSAVVLGLSSAGAENAIAAGTAGVAAVKVASGAGAGSGLSLLYLGLLLAAWPALMSIVTGDGWFAAVFFTLAIALSLIGSMFCGRFFNHSFQVYSLTLGAIVLVFIGIMWWNRPVWDGLSSSLLWFFGTLQALAVSYVILMTVVWKRVYGKPAEGTDV